MNFSRQRFYRFLKIGLLLVGSCYSIFPVFGEGPTDPLIAKVRYLGTQFQDNSVNITGQDCASSIVLPSGESLWVFGDTIEGQFESIRGLPLDDKLSNTAAIVPRQNVSNGIKQYQFLTQARWQAASSDRAVRDVRRSRSSTDLANPWFVQTRRNLCVLSPYLTHSGRRRVRRFSTRRHGYRARRSIGEWKFERLKAPDGSWNSGKATNPVSAYSSNSRTDMPTCGEA